MTTLQTSSRQKPEQSSGIITIQHDEITWHSEDVVFVTFNLSNIIVIGEHTNSNGPWFEDWFLDFVSKDGTWFSIPWYAENIDAFTKLVSDKFQTDLSGSYLTGSTKWASIVRYPANLENKPLFKLMPSKKYKEPKTILDKLLYSLGFGNFDTTQNITLTEEVKTELTNTNR